MKLIETIVFNLWPQTSVIALAWLLKYESEILQSVCGSLAMMVVTLCNVLLSNLFSDKILVLL